MFLKPLHHHTIRKFFNMMLTIADGRSIDFIYDPTQWLCCVMNRVYAVVMLCYEQCLRSGYVML